MATESWSVNIPGEMRFSNFDLSSGSLINTQLQAVSGARLAYKTRHGNWDRPRPAILTPSPYDLDNYVVRMPRGKAVMDYPSYNLRQVYDGSLQLSDPPWEAPSVKDALRNEALIDALVNLKDQKFNAGVAVAEASGVAGMAVGAMRGISKTRRDFLRGDLRSAYNRFRRSFGGDSWNSFKRTYGDSLSRSEKFSAIPNTWLYYHFGIKPTLSDIHDAHVDWFRRHAVPDRGQFRGTVRGQAKHKVKRTEPWSSSHYCVAEDMHMEDVQSMRVYLHVSPQNEFLARLAQLGVMNFPEAAWNGIPFSWMVDYFTSMGDWLSVLDAGMGYEFGNTVESYRRIRRCSAYVFTTSQGHGLSSVQCTPFTSRWTVLDRRVVAELYPPMYRVLPRVKLKGPSVQQFSNVLSVLSGLFSGRSPPNVRI